MEPNLIHFKYSKLAMYRRFCIVVRFVLDQDDVQSKQSLLQRNEQFFQKISPMVLLILAMDYEKVI